MIDMITQRTQPTTITKVRAQANIVGNEHVDKIATDGNKLPDRSLIHPYEKAHPTPYYLHRDNWPSMDQTPDKGPIRHLQPYFQEHEKEHSLKDIARKFPNINKWTNDTNIDNETSNTFWGHPDITDHQSSNLDTINIWVMRTNNYSLVLLYTLTLHVQYVTHQN
jgi:hypothetical protein